MAKTDARGKPVPAPTKTSNLPQPPRTGTAPKTPAAVSPGQLRQAENTAATPVAPAKPKAAPVLNPAPTPKIAAPKAPVTNTPSDTGTLTAPAADISPSDVAANFGYAAWVLSVPELKAIVDQAAAAKQSGTPWTQGQFNTAFNNTNYAKTVGLNEEGFAAQRPGEQKAEVEGNVATLSQKARELGVDIAPDRLQQMASDMAKFKWNPAQITAALGAEFHYKPGGQSGKIELAEQDIRGLASSYLMPLSDATLSDWDSKVAAGADPAVFRQAMVDFAKTRYPSLAKQLDAGITVKQLAEPYAQTASTVLGVNPNSIDFTDPKWGRALSQWDPKQGEWTLMNDYDWQKTLKTDPTYGWDRSPNGVASGYAVGNALSQALGLR